MKTPESTGSIDESDPRNTRNPENSEAPAVRTESAQSVSLILTRGKVAQISPQDATMVMAHKWCATVTKNGHWYAKRKVRKDGKATSEMLHRFIMQAPRGMDVDHANGDGLDNRRENLRLATRSQNMANVPQPVKQGKTSRYRGVSWCKRHLKWHAGITRDGFHRHLGYFASEEAAARAYDVAAKRLYGEFAVSNFAEAVRG